MSALIDIVTEDGDTFEARYEAIGYGHDSDHLVLEIALDSEGGPTVYFDTCPTINSGIAEFECPFYGITIELDVS